MVFIQGKIYLKWRMRAYIINLDEYESIETHWIALHLNTKNVIYVNSFGVENLWKEIIKLIGIIKI